MGYILDIIIVAIAVICIIYGVKKGFFKSLMALVSGIVALLIAFTFTPMLSQYFNDNYIGDRIANGIETTFMSVARTELGNDFVDIDALLENSQFIDLMERAGLGEEDVTELLISSESHGSGAVRMLANVAAEPIAKTVSDILAFVIIFVVSLIVLKIITAVVGIFLKFPALKKLDTALGAVFGIVSALFFVFVFAMMANSVVQALSIAAPGTFSTDIINNSVIVGSLARYNPINALASLFGF